MIETWKPIPRYEEMYEASNFGKIRNRQTLCLLKFRINKGYYLVNLFKNGKPRTHMVHRIIAMTFVGNPMNKREVNHIDEDKLNNRVDNLQWATPKENSNHGTRNQRISKKIKSIRRDGTQLKVCQINAVTNELVRVYDTQVDAMETFGVKTGNISDCCRGKKKTYKGYRWMFYDEYLKSYNLA